MVKIKASPQPLVKIKRKPLVDHLLQGLQPLMILMDSLVLESLMMVQCFNRMSKVLPHPIFTLLQRLSKDSLLTTTQVDKQIITQMQGLV
jgi:hypothetical protein